MWIQAADDVQSSRAAEAEREPSARAFSAETVGELVNEEQACAELTLTVYGRADVPNRLIQLGNGALVDDFGADSATADFQAHDDRAAGQARPRVVKGMGHEVGHHERDVAGNW